MKASKATTRARIEDIARVIIGGAVPFQIGPYVAEMEAKGEPPWTIPPDGKPLSRRQIRRYIRWAERLMAQACRTDTEKLLREHIARRLNLYSRAINKGDDRTALAVLQDLAKLQGLYPSEDDALKREAEALRKQLAALREAGREDGNGTAAEGTGGPRARGEGPALPAP
jgi:hypothetical protein